MTCSFVLIFFLFSAFNFIGRNWLNVDCIAYRPLYACGSGILIWGPWIDFRRFVQNFVYFTKKRVQCFQIFKGILCDLTTVIQWPLLWGNWKLSRLSQISKSCSIFRCFFIYWTNIWAPALGTVLNAGDTVVNKIGKILALTISFCWRKIHNKQWWFLVLEKISNRFRSCEKNKTG